MRTKHTCRGMGLKDSGHLRATRVAHESKRRTHSADTNRRLRFVCERYVCVRVRQRQVRSLTFVRRATRPHNRKQKTQNRALSAHVLN